MSRCRACDAALVWATRADGGRIALDNHEQVGGDYELREGVAVAVQPSDRKVAFREHRCGEVVVRHGVPAV